MVRVRFIVFYNSSKDILTFNHALKIKPTRYPNMIRPLHIQKHFFGCKLAILQHICNIIYLFNVLPGKQGNGFRAFC